MTPSRELRTTLDRLAGAYGPSRLSRDPLSLVRPYADPCDREVAGIVVSSLAFGSVTQILRSGRTVLAALGERPSRGLAVGDTLSDFRHRWIGGNDVVRLLRTLAEILERWGSLQAFFAEGAAGDLGASLTSFSRRTKEIAAREGPLGRGFNYLLPEPAKGGAAKRLCMFLRWMVRPDDGVDLGLWSCLSPADLVIPLDTHVLRLARSLGFTERKTAGWRTAVEVTARLREILPEDPVRYDFALAQLGISRDCLHRPDPERCPRCALLGLCRVSGT